MRCTSRELKKRLLTGCSKTARTKALGRRKVQGERFMDEKNRSDLEPYALSLESFCHFVPEGDTCSDLNQFVVRHVNP